MKKYLTTILVVLMAVFLAFAATSCGKGKTDSSDSVSSVIPSEEIEVKADKAEVRIALVDLDSFDFTSLFDIYVDGGKVGVSADYIDLSKLKKELGTYEIVCSYGGKSAKVTVHVVNERNVFVQANKTKVTIKDVEVKTYDYTCLFTLTINGNITEVKKEYIDASNVLPAPDTYTVTCEYGGSSAKVWVEVTETPFVASALEDEVNVYVGAVNEFEPKALFAITLGGEEVEVTDDMITGEVKPEVGDYEIKLSIGSRKASVIVHVVNEHVIKIGSAYSEIDIAPEDVSSYDFINDFYIYEDGKSVEVNSENVTLDTSALTGAAIGDKCEISVSYVPADGKGGATKTVIVNVTAVGSIAIKVLNAEVFESDTLDLTSLFEITDNGEEIEVTDDMISGFVDFGNSDECKITLTYKNIRRTATVKKIKGISIRYAAGEIVSVKKGENKGAYDFAGDFEVYIDGIRFYGIAGWIDTNNVNFDAIGVYDAVLTVKYNDASIFGKPQFAATKTKTIKYNVVPSVYELKILEKTVELEAGSADYDVLSNIELSVNGYRQSFTANRGEVNMVTTYYEIVSAPDLTVTGSHKVTINLYVYGLGYDSVTAEYTIIVKNGIKIYSEDKAVFTGETLYAPDLFRVYENGKAVNVTPDMISGRINPFVAGSYVLTVEYKGVTRSATVSVIPSDYVGDYQTADKTIAKDSVEGEDGDIAEDEKPSVAIGDMEIGRDMSIFVHGVKAENVTLTDYGFDFMLCNNAHEAHFENGVCVIVPLNELKLSYYDDNRPLVYFKRGVWAIADSVSVHYSKEGKSVYSLTYSGYSIFLYKVRNLETNELKWFAIKVTLEAKTSSDTMYSVAYGFVNLPSDFSSKTIGAVGDFELNGSRYVFSISERGTGKINKTDTTAPFANKSFTGMFDGKAATLSLGNEHQPTLTVGGIKKFSMNTSEFHPKYNYYSTDEGYYILYGYEVVTFNKKYNTKTISYSTDLFIKEKDTDDEQITVTPFSYKFLLDADNETFTLAERDEYFGLYKNGEGRFVFLDGYGNGIIDTTKDSIGQYGFTYTAKSSLITVVYDDPSNNLSQKRGVFSIDAFGNVLYAQSCGKEFEKGDALTNAYITSGAAVTLSRSVFHKGETKDDIINAVKIVTKDGEYSLTAKKQKVTVNGKQVAIVDVSKISTGNAGFYLLEINLKLDGASSVSTKRFAVQVLDEVLPAGEGFARNYGYSISGLTSFALNTFGEAEFVVGGVSYTGYATVADGKLYAKLTAAYKGTVSITGEINDDEILTLQIVTADGTLLLEHYSVGTVLYAGNGELIIRSFATSKGNVFYISSALSVLGDKVTIKTTDGEDVSAISVGSVVAFTYDGKNYVLRVAALGDEKNGLEISDLLEGEYEDLSGRGETLTLDGYGSGVLNGTRGTYYVYNETDNGKRLVFTTTSGTFIKLLIGTGGDKLGKFVSYGEVAEKDLSGKSYTGDVGDYEITATVTMKFEDNGKVTLSYSSSDGSPAPDYAGTGTYAVTNGKIVISVKGYVITLTFEDPWMLSELEVSAIARPADYEEPNSMFRVGLNFRR